MSDPLAPDAAITNDNDRPLVRALRDIAIDSKVKVDFGGRRKEGTSLKLGETVCEARVLRSITCAPP
jgi:hypothetical protein